MNNIDNENLTEEEKARRGLELLGLITAMSATKKAQNPGLQVAKMEKELYDNYISVGFNPDQALTLTRDKIKSFLDPRSK